MPLFQPNHQPVSLTRRLLSPAALVSFAVAGAFILFLVTRFDIDLDTTWDSLKSSDLVLFVGAIAVHYTTFLFRGARWKLLLENAQSSENPQKPAALHCGLLLLLGWFVNSVTWFRLGDAFRAHAYSEDTGSGFPHTIGTIVAERFLDMILVLALLLLATAILVATGTGTSWVFVGLAGLMAALIGGILASMGFFRERLLNILPSRLQGPYRLFNDGTMASFGRLHLATALGLLGWASEMGRLMLVTEALDLPLGVPLVIFVTLANAMLTLAPITPGGLGAVEWGVTSLLLLGDNISTETAAFSVVALDRSISWLSVIAVGGCAFIGRELWKRRRNASSASVESEQVSADTS